MGFDIKTRFEQVWYPGWCLLWMSSDNREPRLSAWYYFRVMVARVFDYVEFGFCLNIDLQNGFLLLSF